MHLLPRERSRCKKSTLSGSASQEGGKNGKWGREGSRLSRKKKKGKTGRASRGASSNFLLPPLQEKKQTEE